MITNGSIADLAVAWARTDAGMQGFQVPTGPKGFSANKIAGKLSLRASVTSELVRQGCGCPPTWCCGGSSLCGPLSCLDEARFGIVLGALGTARDCLEIAVDHYRTREVFNQPIDSHQLTQQKLPDMTLELAEGLPARVALRTAQGRGKTQARTDQPRHSGPGRARAQ